MFCSILFLNDAAKSSATDFHPGIIAPFVNQNKPRTNFKFCFYFSSLIGKLSSQKKLIFVQMRVCLCYCHSYF